jgi:hypothetical protein
LTLAAPAAQTQHDRSINIGHPAEGVVPSQIEWRVLVIATVGQAYRFITRLNTVEWMEFQLLHDDAKAALEAAAENGMMIVQATNAVRALFARAKLL